MHDVSLDALSPIPALQAGLERLPGRRLVFTNGSAEHAVRVLEQMEIADCFDGVFAIEDADLTPQAGPCDLPPDVLYRIRFERGLGGLLRGHAAQSGARRRAGHDHRPDRDGTRHASIAALIDHRPTTSPPS